jgi:hypothetical protein
MSASADWSPDTIQYLNERFRDERKWLETLSHLSVGTSLVWGLHDNVSPLGQLSVRVSPIHTGGMRR